MTLSLALGACQAESPVSPAPDSALAYVPGISWRTAAPAAVGFDSAAMAGLAAGVAAGRFGQVQAIAVVRFGYLVHEQHVGWDRGRPHTLQSVTKSVAALLYGILWQQQPGDARLDRPVLDLFSRYRNLDNVSAQKRLLTTRDLLTMRTGMDFWENPYAGSPLDSMNRSRGDWVRFILDRPMTGRPGEAWAYNSGAAILVCAAIREILGEPPDVFARRELFDPIGVTTDSWFRSPFDSLPHCGGGLSLAPLDLARIGYLVLRRGRWGARRIVPQDWLEEAARPHSTGRPLFFSEEGAGYGYLWWLFPVTRRGPGSGVIAASGAGGQWLFVVPELDLVVVVMGTQAYGLDLLYDGVLNAIRREAP
jgi:CubicO group peptidase (beta-lactamase class C family)